MKLKNLPSDLQKAFGSKNLFLREFIDPLCNESFGLCFIDKDGTWLNPTSGNSQDNCVFYEILGGPFYELELVGFMLNFSRPFTKRMPVWKNLCAVAKDKDGKVYYSAILSVKANLSFLNDYVAKNGISWCDSDKVFNGIKTYVQWLKTTDEKTGSTSLR